MDEFQSVVLEQEEEGAVYAYPLSSFSESHELLERDGKNHVIEVELPLPVDAECLAHSLPRSPITNSAKFLSYSPRRDY